VAESDAPAAKPELIVVGGANGSGKTTFSMKYASLHDCPYLGADAIAAELSPGKPELAAVAAGKEFLTRLAKVIAEGITTVVESTLSGRSLRHAVADARNAGFTISIVYVYLDSADACVKRVAERVQKGGHSVPEEDVRRRFSRSLVNFWKLYRPLADRWSLWYNSMERLTFVAKGTAIDETILNPDLFALFHQLMGLGDD
jgi:predicted ABC-type ATPase